MAEERSWTWWWPGLTSARENAAAQGAGSVGTQHVLLALIAGHGEAAAALSTAGIHRAPVIAALQGIAGIGARAQPVALERVSLSPRVGAMIRRASQGAPGEIEDAAVLGELLDERDEPSLAGLALTSLGLRRRAMHAYRSLAPTRIGPGDGDLVAG